MGARGVEDKTAPNYTATLDAIVVALCADYERRESLLCTSSVGRRVAMEYRYINSRMYEAAAEIAGDRYAVQYIIEIGSRIGYTHSRVGFLSEVSYKEQKRCVKLNIARKMHLLD